MESPTKKNLLVWRYSSTFFEILERKSRIPYPAKCLLLSMLLYAPGLILAYSQGMETFYEFLLDFGFFAACLTVGLTLWALIGFFKHSDETVRYLNEVFNDDGYEEFANLMRSRGQKRKDTLLYYTVSIGSGLAALFLAINRVVGAWWVSNPHTGHSSFTMFIYFITWCTIVGSIVGITFFWRVVGCIHTIREYGRRFATPEKIIALAPDKTGGLGILGNLSFKLDKAVSIPSITVLAYISKAALAPLLHPYLTEQIGISFAGGYIIALVYTVFLAAVFFLPLSPVHSAMLEAKNNSLRMIDGEFRRLYPEMIKEIKDNRKTRKSEFFERIKQLYILHDRAKKMAVWPLNFGLISKFLITVTIPLIGTFLLEIVVNLVLDWILVV